MVVLSAGRCAVHDNPSECELPMRAHHVITQQALRKAGLDAFRWETENGLPVCEGVHRRHHSRLTPIPFACLPEDAVRFAEYHGLGWQLDRYYAK